MAKETLVIDKKDFQDLLKEIKNYNKLDLLAQAFQTKYAKEAVGDDDEARRKDAAKTNELLERMLIALTGTKSKADASITKKGKDKPFSIQEDLKQFKQELKSGVAFGKRVVGGAVDAFKSPVETFKKGAIGAAKINERLYQQAGDILGTPEDYEPPKKDKQPTAKQKIEKTGKAENPNIVDKPEEKVAEESEKQTGIFTELLTATKESLDQLKSIRNSLEGKPTSGSAQPASKTAPVLAAPATEESGPGLLDVMGNPLRSSAGAATPAAGAAKAGIGAKIMGGLKAGGAMIGKGALAAGKFVAGAALAKPALIAGGIGLAAYGAYKGYQALTGGDESGQEGVDPTTGAAPQVESTPSNATYMINGVPVSKEEYEVHNAKIKERSRQLAEGGAAALQIPSIEGRQAGGPVTEGKPYLVGEKGPEVIVPSQNATVVPKNKKAAKSTPQIVETIEMPDGSKKEILDDGSYKISNAEGTTKYDAKGAKLSHTSASISGFTRKEDFTTGETELRYANAGLYASERRNKAGELIRTEASYDTGSGRMSMVEAGGKRTSSFELRDGSEQNTILKEEMTSGQIQPIISNNVSNNNQTTYVPVKGEPRATHRGSALDNYNNRVASY